MDFPDLHPWDLTPRQAIALQAELAVRVDLRDRVPAHLRLVAGADVSYQKDGERFHAAVVVLDATSLRVVETVTATLAGSFPYIPGLLSFRELPSLLVACRKLQHRPDVLLADAQGIAHPRRLGLASHLGLWLGLPTIGCAKSRLCGDHAEPGGARGDWVPLVFEGAEVGRVVRTRDRVRPMYVSPGHRVSMTRAMQIVLQCGGGYRLPEPTRQAHLASNQVRVLSDEKREVRG